MNGGERRYAQKKLDNNLEVLLGGFSGRNLIIPCRFCLSTELEAVQAKRANSWTMLDIWISSGSSERGKIIQTFGHPFPNINRCMEGENTGCKQTPRKNHNMTRTDAEEKSLPLESPHGKRGDLLRGGEKQRCRVRDHGGGSSDASLGLRIHSPPWSLMFEDVWRVFEKFVNIINPLRGFMCQRKQEAIKPGLFGGIVS